MKPIEPLNVLWIPREEAEFLISEKINEIIFILNVVLEESK